LTTQKSNFETLIDSLKSPIIYKIIDI